MMKYFYVDPFPGDKDKLVVHMTEEFYDFMDTLNLERDDPNFSFMNIFPRLYGLFPRDFFKYVSAVYNATLFPKVEQKYIQYYFTSILDAMRFCRDADERMNALVNRNKGEE